MFSPRLLPDLPDLRDVGHGYDGTHYGPRTNEWIAGKVREELRLTFWAPPPPGPGLQRTVLAESTGFYHLYTDQSGPRRPEVMERILTEPLFGNRYVLEQLRLSETEQGLR